MQTTRRLLTILATTVETLEVEVSYEDGTICSILQDGLIELPKLSAIRMRSPQQGIRLAFSSIFKRYTSITTLSIFHFHSLDMSLDDSDLPALRSLQCCDDLAMRLIPKRPITTFLDVRGSYEEGPWVLLKALRMSKTSTRITNLKISISDRLSSLLPCLGTSFPDLEQLTLKCLRFVPGEIFLLRSAAVILPKLKRVIILVEHDQFKPPYVSSEWLREQYFIPRCPALEVFECLRFPFYKLGSDFGLPSEPDLAWKTRRLPDGGWERQGPPPIPTPVPASK